MFIRFLVHIKQERGAGRITPDLYYPGLFSTPIMLIFGTFGRF